MTVATFEAPLPDRSLPTATAAATTIPDEGVLPSGLLPQALSTVHGGRLFPCYNFSRHPFSDALRLACRVIGGQRMTGRYRRRRPDDSRLRQRLVALARERRRFGYR
jgi:hypothetical protein